MVFTFRHLEEVSQEHNGKPRLVVLGTQREEYNNMVVSLGDCGKPMSIFVNLVNINLLCPYL